MPAALAKTPADPGLVGRILDYVCEARPELKAHRDEIEAAICAEFQGEECYIPARSRTKRQELVASVLANFNGKNAREVARKLRIGRATVYRILKQPGRQAESGGIGQAGEVSK